MNSTELLSMFRDEMADQELPYLWSDAAIYRYIDDAQKMFCRLTEGIEDTRTDSVTELSITPGESWYDTSPLILKTRNATRTDNGRDVPIVNVEKSRHGGIQFDGQTGPLKFLVSGFERNALRAWPVPDETVTVTLSVFRLPLNSIDDAGQDLEIDEQHHQRLLLWVKHLAYDKQDSETFNKSKSAEYEQRFHAYCVSARAEQERRRRNTGTVIYGGI